MSLRSLFALLLPALVLVAGPALAADYAWPVVRVVDGDTVAVDASADMPPELADVKSAPERCRHAGEGRPRQVPG